MNGASTSVWGGGVGRREEIGGWDRHHQSSLLHLHLTLLCCHRIEGWNHLSASPPAGGKNTGHYPSSHLPLRLCPATGDWYSSGVSTMVALFNHGRLVLLRSVYNGGSPQPRETGTLQECLQWWLSSTTGDWYSSGVSTIVPGSPQPLKTGTPQECLQW